MSGSGILDDLLSISDTPKVTIVMPARRGEETQDAIRLRGLVARAQGLLDRRGTPRPVVAELTGTTHDLVVSAHPWQDATRAVAIFAAPGHQRLVRLPVTVDELVTVGDEFHVVGLVAPLDPTHCFVLTLTRGGAALWRATRWELAPLELPDAPEALTDITQYQDLERQLQVHQMARGGSETGTAGYHGHGVGEGRDVESVRAYLRLVDKAVIRATTGDASPVLVVGPDTLPPLYRSVSSHPHLAARSVESHPDGIGNGQLHDHALGLLDELVTARREALLGSFEAQWAADKASADVAAVVLAATEGRLGSLLFDPERRVWGRVSRERFAVAITEEDEAGTEELVNRAVVETLRHGGEAVPVTDVDMPSPILGLYRY